MINSIADTLRAIIERGGERSAVARDLAETIRSARSYRWLGLYDVDYARGEVAVIGWSGPGPPAYPRFPLDHGLSARAISTQQTVNVLDVASDPSYLTAFGSTRSEIIVPIVDGRRAVGTLDVESEHVAAFDAAAQRWLESCAEILRPFWRDRSQTEGRP